VAMELVGSFCFPIFTHGLRALSLRTEMISQPA
jgi:hypothetical protein